MNCVPTDVVLVEKLVVVDDVDVVVLYVTTVVARVTPRKFEAKSRPSPVGQVPPGATATVHA